MESLRGRLLVGDRSASDSIHGAEESHHASHDDRRGSRRNRSGSVVRLMEMVIHRNSSCEYETQYQVNGFFENLSHVEKRKSI